MAQSGWREEKTPLNLEVTVEELISLLMTFSDDTILAAVSALVNYVEDDDAYDEWARKVAADHAASRGDTGCIA